MIEFDHVSKTYKDGTKAVKDFSLQINEGELFTLIGPSGCGKTTTMKMINRLVKPTDGTIKIADKKISDYDMHQLRWNIGYVLQQIALFPHMTIEENISIVPEMKKWKKDEIKERIKVLLDMVGLDPKQFMNRMPHELSGGQQQRIGVVRALAADPDIILMDEPFSALDPISREQLQKDIQALQKKIQKTIVFVTHDMDEALAISDRICLMKEGEIIQVGTPKQLILHPENEFARTFIGDKRSPWQESVETLLVHNESRTNDREGVEKEAITIAHDQAVVEAVKLFEDNNTELLRVVKGEQTIGEISYRDILRFLRKHIKLENGVMK
ncbi:glycine/betaine ABC transporter ATP-binding protein [Paraliobacillus quinghaiensis]|uniref:Quaternary amine transport ATP-binding protein n=1 Tax=Paraliobacillus quinghaiensis TaxID=470815 RepID=A0A917TVE4_9BACI|nr:ABC transporter ATP-binding protein [Paraliobacillus quinghaiensis]GGM37676.1 glycine/betaine ABC transporter ATP-binding protein [Paraliobacillus quinghaiensis]